VGFAGGRIAQVKTNHVLLKNYSVVGVYVGEYSARERSYLDEIHTELMELHAAGKIRTLVQAELPLEDAPSAISDLAQRRTVGKVIIRP
jgi:NADPH2:quinone reductase